MPSLLSYDTPQQLQRKEKGEHSRQPETPPTENPAAARYAAAADAVHARKRGRQLQWWRVGTPVTVTPDSCHLVLRSRSSAKPRRIRTAASAR